MTVVDDDGKVLASPDKSIVGSTRKLASATAASATTASRSRSAPAVSQRTQSGDARNLESALEGAADVPPTPDEIALAESSDSFQKFVDDSTRVMTRVLEQNETFDVLVDYSGADLSDTQTARAALLKPSARSSRNRGALGEPSHRLRGRHTFGSFLPTSYSKSRVAGDSVDSIVAIWSLGALKRPECLSVPRDHRDGGIRSV